MVEEFKAGGAMMWLLLACLVAGLALSLERLFTIFLRMNVDVKRFSRRLMQTVDKQGIQAGVELCAKNRSPVAKVLGSALERADQSRERIEDAIVRTGATELAFLDRGMPLIAGLTTVAPFVGFLGTVTGMISAFKAVAAVGDVDPTVVSSGIAEALITTKWGLMIAAPLSLVHILFSMRINGYLREMETASAELVDYLVGKRG